MKRLRGRFAKAKKWRLDFTKAPDPFGPTLYLIWIGPFKGVFFFSKGINP